MRFPIVMLAVLSCSTVAFAFHAQAQSSSGAGSGGAAGSFVGAGNQGNENGAIKAKTLPCDATCLEARRERRPDFWDEKTGVLGLRGSFTRVRGSDADGSYWGMTFAGSSEDYTTKFGIARHGSAFWAIGGGSGGFEGALGAKLAIGWRLPAGEDQGPVLRIGMQGWLQGNQQLYSSLIELPLAQLGYQFTRDKTVVELGVQAGPVLAGRFSVGDDARRKLGSAFEGTVYGALHFEHMRLDASFMRIETRHPITSDRAPTDFARATLCALGSPIGVCAEAWSYSGVVRLTDATGQPFASDARAVYLGLLVGVTER